MRIWLSELSIQKKLWIFNLMTAAISGLVAAALLIVVIWKVEYAAARKNVEIEAAIIAENVLPALQFRDAVTARDVLAGLGRDSEVIAARIIEPGGSVFAEFSPKRPETSERFFSAGHFRVEIPMRSGNEHLASLELISDTADFVETIVTYVSAVGLATVLSLLIGSYVVVRLQRAITDPLSELSRLMSEVSAGGDLSRRSAMANHDELGMLSDSFNRMIEQIELRNAELGKELAERMRAEKQLEHLAHHDPVTGLPNRHFFRKRASDLTRGNAFAGEGMALLFVDLDNFKYINDTFGHEQGDQLLVAVAERLSASVRGHDMVVRFGGDEFVVLLDRVGESAAAMRLAQKLLESVTRPLALGGNEFVVTCSIGVALAPEHAGNFDELLQKADAAMYEAKAAGKNGVCLWEHRLSIDSSLRFTLEYDLRQALARNELEMHYQPVVELVSGRIAGMEALMRWRHPVRGFISPAEFIPVAEETGLILELGDWAMSVAFAQGALWNRRFGPLFIAVNVSSRQFRDPLFSARAEAVARGSGLARGLSEIELTESIIMGRTGEAVRLLEDLAGRGFSLSLDDFGTGYSSLSYLKRFPLDKLKIDRSFVQDLPDDASASAIAEAIIGLSKTLSLCVVAEGIETAAQSERLRELGCMYGQGFYFSKALPVEQMAVFIAESLVKAEQA